MSELNGDLLRADEKIEQGLDWQDTIPIPVAGDKLEFGFSLLNERVRQRVENELSLDEFRQYRNEDMSKEYERFMELQRKDELTDEQQDELMELAKEVNPEEEGRDSLGDGAIDALMDAGKHAIEPTDGDIQDILNADPQTQERILGDVPDHMDKDVARQELKDYWTERVEEQPFPIKMQIGQRAWMETMSVMGNGFQNT
jgi:hypothetical protein